MSTQVTIKQLLEAGVHFGHQTRRWNPKMAKYIFGERNGIYIIDLQKTHKKLGDALEYVKDLTAKKGTILFVGTKKQAQEPVEEAARRCGMPFVNQRWLGGMLTNFATVKKSLGRFAQLKRQKEDGTFATLPKEEAARKERELQKLSKALSGFETLRGLPDAIFIIDTKKERNAVAEAKRLQIPLVALVDTNCDPEEVDHPIPSNDDAIRTLKLMCSLMADTVIAGRQIAAAADQAAKDKKAEAATPAA